MAKLRLSVQLRTPPARSNRESSTNPRHVLWRKGPLGGDIAFELAVGPEGAHQPAGRMIGGSQKEVTDFMRDGATEQRPRVHSGPRGEDVDAVGVHGRQGAALPLKIDDRAAK